MMTTTFISSLNFWNAPGSGLTRLRSALAQANTETVSWRHADLGLALGADVGRSLDLRQQSETIDALIDSNGVATLRLGTSQAALDQIRGAADTMLKTLTGLPAAQRAETLAATAGTALTALGANLNASAGGQYVFGGTNTATPPVDPQALAGAREAIDRTFRASFGVAPGSAGAAAITAGQMQDFLAGPVAALFSQAGWAARSQASSTAITSRISLSESATTSVSANEAAIRTLATAYAFGAATGLAGLSAEARDAATEGVMGLLSRASSGLTAIQADLGRSQARITEAKTRMDSQKTLLAGEVTRLEAVDPAEAKSRVDALTTQIQMSYALTSQLRQLSLVSFLS